MDPDGGFLEAFGLRSGAFLFAAAPLRELAPPRGRPRSSSVLVDPRPSCWCIVLAAFVLWRGPGHGVGLRLHFGTIFGCREAGTFCFGILPCLGVGDRGGSGWSRVRDRTGAAVRRFLGGGVLDLDGDCDEL